MTPIITFEEWKQEQLTQGDQPLLTPYEFDDYLAQENIMPHRVMQINKACEMYESLIECDYIQIMDCNTFVGVTNWDLQMMYESLVEDGEI